MKKKDGRLGVKASRELIESNQRLQEQNHKLHKEYDSLSSRFFIYERMIRLVEKLAEKAT